MAECASCAVRAKRIAAIGVRQRALASEETHARDQALEQIAHMIADDDVAWAPAALAEYRSLQTEADLLEAESQACAARGHNVGEADTNPLFADPEAPAPVAEENPLGDVFGGPPPLPFDGAPNPLGDVLAEPKGAAGPPWWLIPAVAALLLAVITAFVFGSSGDDDYGTAAPLTTPDRDASIPDASTSTPPTTAKPAEGAALPLGQEPVDATFDFAAGTCSPYDYTQPFRLRSVLRDDGTIGLVLEQLDSAQVSEGAFAVDGLSASADRKGHNYTEHYELERVDAAAVRGAYTYVLDADGKTCVWQITGELQNGEWRE